MSDDAQQQTPIATQQANSVPQVTPQCMCGSATAATTTTATTTATSTTETTTAVTKENEIISSVNVSVSGNDSGVTTGNHTDTEPCLPSPLRFEDAAVSSSSYCDDGVAPTQEQQQEMFFNGDYICGGEGVAIRMSDLSHSKHRRAGLPVPHSPASGPFPRGYSASSVASRSSSTSSCVSTSASSRSASVMQALSVTHRKTHQYESSNLDRSENAVIRAVNYAESNVPNYGSSLLSFEQRVTSVRLFDFESSSSMALQWWKDTGSQWLCVACIGVFTALIAFLVSVISTVARTVILRIINAIGNDNAAKHIASCLVFATSGAIFGTIAGLILLLFDPGLRAATTEALCFLNGIVVDKSLTIKNLIAHVTSLVMVSSSPLCVCKEGPMLGIGSQVGYAISRLGHIRGLFDEYDVRDMVSVGLASGMAAAFGAPAGAVIFALEKGFHFSISLLQKLLFSCMLACFVLSFLLTGVHENKWGDFSTDSLCHFGQFSNSIFNIKQLFAFVLMGIVGGLIGSLYNFLHLLVARFRKAVFKTPRMRFLEVILLSLITGTIAASLSSWLPRCTPLPPEDGDVDHSELLGVFCPTGEYNLMATLLINNQESAINFLFHESTSVDRTALIVFCLVFFVLSVYSTGAGVPNGFFMPPLLVGASAGRLLGEVLHDSLQRAEVNAGFMAFIGAASVLGGVTRITMSLAVVLSEAVNQAAWLLFLMIDVIFAKVVGEFIIPGITTIDFRLKDYPVLEWDAPHQLCEYIVHDVMHKPVIALPPLCTVRQIQRVLESCSHNGFPVVNTTDIEKGDTPLLGLALRKQLEELVRNATTRTADELEVHTEHQPNADTDAIAAKQPHRHHKKHTHKPSWVTRNGVCVSNATTPGPEHTGSSPLIDLEPLVYHTVTVPPHISCERAFHIFRTLGLRHLVVVDENNVPVGIVTRKDLFFLRTAVDMVDSGGIVSQSRIARRARSLKDRLSSALYGN